MPFLLYATLEHLADSPFIALILTTNPPAVREEVKILLFLTGENPKNWF